MNITSNSWHEEFISLWEAETSSKKLPFSESVRRFCINKIGDIDQANDVFSEILWRVYRGYPSLRDKNLFHRWVFKIARNEINREIIRKIKERDSTVSLSSNEEILNSSENDIEYNMFIDGLYKAIAQAVKFGELSELEQTIFNMRQDNPLITLNEIAHKLNITPGNCRIIFMRSTRKFQAFLFLFKPELLGGKQAIQEAYICAQNESKQKLTSSENKVFKNYLLDKKFVITPQIREDFQSACSKIIYFAQFTQHFAI